MKSRKEEIMSNYPSETIKDITEFLFIGKDKIQIKKSDLVIVLGNDFIEGTVEELFDLYQNEFIEKNATIILSGATGSLNKGKERECVRMYNCAVDKYEMPPELFIKEPNAKNACQNFEYSKRIIDKLGGFERFDSILCIGKAFLLRRASMYASKFGYPANKMQYYGTVDTQGRNIGKNTWWKTDSSIERVMAEIERIGKYYKNGDLSIW